jgi:hypothetical protein
MLHLKTADTAPALLAAKERYAEIVKSRDATMAERNQTARDIADHDNAAAAADREAVNHGDMLADLVGRNADESERAPERAAHSDAIAKAAFHRREASAKREQLPALDNRVGAGDRAWTASDPGGVNAAEFNDALAAYVEHLPVLEPLVTRLRDACGRQIHDDMHQFSALPKIRGGQLFGLVIGPQHYAQPSKEVAQ